MTALIEDRFGWVGFVLICVLELVLLPAQRAFAAGGWDELTLFATGTMYEAGSNRKNLWYQWTLSTSEDGSRRSTEYITPDGELAASEYVLLENGELEEYTVLEHTAGRKALVRRVEDKVVFSYTKDGHTETRSEDYGEGLVVGQTLIPYIQSHWKRLMRDEDVRVRFAIFRRLRTIWLKIQKEDEEEGDGGKRVLLKIRPRSLILSAFVKPIYLTFSRDGRTVYNFIGRTIPLRLVNGSWKPARVDGIFRDAGQDRLGLTLPNVAVSE